MELAGEILQQINLTDSTIRVMVEGTVPTIGIEFLRLYGSESAKSVSSAYQNQQIGAPTRLLEPRRMLNTDTIISRNS